MKKLVYACNIVSAIPAVILIPLTPFVFILINGEGRIPGMFHEHAVSVLMYVYPLALAACLVGSIKLIRKDRVRPALIISLIPLVVFMLLAALFHFGGVRLN